MTVQTRKRWTEPGLQAFRRFQTGHSTHENRIFMGKFGRLTVVGSNLKAWFGRTRLTVLVSFMLRWTSRTFHMWQMVIEVEKKRATDIFFGSYILRW